MKFVSILSVSLTFLVFRALVGPVPPGDAGFNMTQGCRPAPLQGK